MFGFSWFEITQIVIRQRCFFLDICLNGDPWTPDDFEGSLYGTDLAVDVPAIMQIIVRRNGVEVPNSPFTNLDNSDEVIAGPLCVRYPDILDVQDEVFTFELQLWLRASGGGWAYQTYATYTSTDHSPLDVDPGDDGVLDFVVGTCGNEGDADQVFGWLYGGK